MAVTFDAAAKTNFIQRLVVAYETAVLTIKDAGNVTLATITFVAADFTGGASGAFTLDTGRTPQATAVASGTPTQYSIALANGGTETGTVSYTGGGGDITIDNGSGGSSIVVGGVVKITSMSRSYA